MLPLSRPETRPLAVNCGRKVVVTDVDTLTPC